MLHWQSLKEIRVSTPAEYRVGNSSVSKGFDQLERASANHTHRWFCARAKMTSMFVNRYLRYRPETFNIPRILDACRADCFITWMHSVCLALMKFTENNYATTIFVTKKLYIEHCSYKLRYLTVLVCNNRTNKDLSSKTSLICVLH